MYMRQLLTACLDLIFPPSEQEKLLREATEAAVRTLYQPGPYQHTTYLARYTEPLVRAAITENKFNDSQPGAKLLAALLGRYLATLPKDTLCIPIPLGKTRERERGYNQVERVLQQVPERPLIRTDILVRRVDTTAQTELNRSARLENMRGAFTCAATADTFAHYSAVVLLDDVVTTEATMAASRASLAPHLPTHVTLHCVALAH